MALTSPITTGQPSFVPTNSFMPKEADPKDFKREAATNSSPDWTKDSWLNEGLQKPSKGKFSLRLFANESCSPFIAGSTLQGSSFVSSLSRFFDCLDSSGVDKKSLTMLPLLQGALEMAKEISRVTDVHEEDKILTSIQAVAQKLNDRVSNLKPGEKILIPGGWIAGMKEYSLLYLIEKQKDGTYSLGIFNTNQGIQFHKNTIENGVLLCDPCLQIEKIRSKNLCQTDFFQALVEFQTLPKWRQSLEFSAENIYVGLVNSLKGKKVISKFVKDSSFMVKPQIQGNCTFDLVFGFLHSTIINEASTLKAKQAALKEYEKIKFAYEKQSLIDACSHFFDPATPWSRTEHKLIKANAGKLARTALRLHGEVLISDKEYKACASTQLDIKQRLAAKKQEAKQIKSAPLSYTLGMSGKIEAEEKLHLPKFSVKPNDVLGKKKAPLKIPPFPSPHLEDITSDKITETLTDWVKQVEAFSKHFEVDAAHIQESLNRFMYALPLPKETDFWDLVPEQQITECLEQLFKLSRLYFFKSSTTSFSTGKEPLPKTIIGSHIAMAIGEHLARRQEVNKLNNYCLDYRSLIAFSQTPEAILANPLDQKKLQELLKAIVPAEYDLSKQLSKKKLNGYYRDAILTPNDSLIDDDVKSIQIYRDFLPEAQIEMSKRGHSLKSINEQIAILMCESVNGTKLLPKSLLYLRQLSFFANGIITKPYLSSEQIEEWLYTIDKPKKYTANVRVSLKSMPNEHSLYISSPLGYREKGKAFIDNVEYLQKPKDSSSKINLHFLMESQNKIMAKQLEEEKRDSAINSADKVDEVVRALSYYQDRSESLFEDPVEQYIFAQHLLRSGRLLNQLVNEPQMAIKLMSFINNRLAFFQSCGKKEPSIYFCKLGHYCSRYVRLAQKENPENFKGLDGELKTVLIDYRKLILTDILPHCRSIQERNDLYQHLTDLPMGSEIQSLSNSEIIDMAQDYFVAKIFGPIAMAKDKPKSLWSSKVTKQSYAALMPRFRDVLETDPIAKDRILNAILESVKQKPCDLKWSGKFPRFTSDPFKIDLIEFRVSENDKVAANLPENIFHHPYFDLLFEKITEIQIKPDGRYLIYDSHGITELEYDGENDSLKAERQIGGKNYRFIPAKKFPQKFLDAVSYQIIDETTSIWVNLEQPNPHYLIKREKQEEGNKEKDLKILLKTVDNSSFTIGSITDDPAGKRILVNPWSTPYLDPLKFFEDPAYIACWTNPKDPACRVTEIDMKRLGLHFDISADPDGTFKAWCRDVPGYYLSEDQSVDFGDQWPNYLVLKNALGQKKIIMAGHHFSSSHNNKTPFDITLNQNENKPHFLLIYDLEEIEGIKRLKASSVRDSLYLASLLLKKKGYKEALYYIERSFNLGIFSETDLGLIKMMLNHFFKDGHPLGLVVGFKVLLLSEENRLKYDPSYHLSFNPNKNKIPKNNDWGKASQVYILYLQNLDNVLGEKLSIEEEKSLLRLFVTHNVHKHPIILQRIDQLMQPKDKIRKTSLPAASLSPSTFVIKDSLMHTFFSLFKKKNEGKAPSAPGQFLTDMTEDSFRANFPAFYESAKKGNVPTRKHIFNALQLFKGTEFYNKPTHNQEICGLVKILESVLERPEKFPRTEEIVKLQENYSWVNRGHREFFQNKILRNLNYQPYSFKSLLTSLKKFFMFLRVNWGLKTATIRKLMFQMPSELKNGTKGKISLKADLKSLDQSDDAFFDEILKKFFISEEKKVEDAVKITETAKDPLSKAFFDEMIKNLEEFYAARPQTKTVYHLNAEKNLDELADSLSKSLAVSANNLTTQETELLALVNKPSLENFYKDVLEQTGKKKPALSFSQAVDLFEQGNLQKYQQLTYLNKEEIDKFESLMTAYLVASTRREQAFRIYSNVQAFQKLPVDSDEKKIIIQRLGEEITNKRQYSDPSKNQAYVRSFLVFEHRNKLLLRKKQVDTIDKIYNHPNRAKLMHKLMIQLGTGYGKSKVLASLFEWISRIDGSLVINLWPSALYPVNKYDMKRQVESTFNQRADTFDFDRSTSTDIFHLTFTEREVKQAKLEGRQLNARPESLQCVELKFLETLYNASNKGLRFFNGKICSFQHTMQEIKNAEVHFDEGHITLSSKKEVNFTIGEPITEPPDNILFLEEMFRYLSQDLEILKWIDIKANLQYLVSDDTIKNELCPLIAKHMMHYLGIGEDKEKEFLNYVMDKATSCPHWVSEHLKKEQIGLLKGNLTKLLPDMLHKKLVNVHYGLSKKENGVEYVKPYEASDSPVENSNYDNIHEALGKTYLTYLHCRLTVDRMSKLIKHLQTSALSESKRRLIDVKDTKAYQFYSQHFPSEMGGLFNIEKRHLETWLSKINASDEVIFYYLRTFVTPSMNKYGLKLKSDSQNLRSQVGRMVAMSATPGNSAKYGLKTQFQPDLGSDEQVLDALEKKCKDPSTMHTLSAKTSIEFFDNILNKIFVGKTNYRALIDIGALFKGLNNLDMAKKLLSHFAKENPDIRGVVFFHEDSLYVLETGSDEPIPFEQSQLKPEQRFTLYDHKHAFGADVKQFSEAKALATFSNHSTKDDILQGVGRMRELLQEQTVEWVTLQEIMDAVCPKDQQFTFGNLRNMSIENLSDQEADELYRSLKQQMRDDIRSVLMNKLIYARSESRAVRLFKDFSPILIEKVELDAFKLYGGISTELTDPEDLIIYRNELLLQLKKLKRISRSEKAAIRKQLQSYDKSIAELKSKLSAEKKRHLIKVGIEAEIQQQVETKVETKLEVINNNLNQLQKLKPTHWDENLDLYRSNWIKPSPTYMMRIRQILLRLTNAPSTFSNLVIKKPLKTLGLMTDHGPSPLAVPLIMAVVAVTAPIFIGALAVSVGASIGMGVLSVMGNISKLSVPLYEGSSIVQVVPYRDASSAHTFFKNRPEANLLMTNNFIAVVPQAITSTPVEPLGKEQKPLYEVLVVQEEQGGKKSLTVIMGDQSTDARFWRKKLEADLKTNPADAKERKRKICLYDLNIGIVQNGKNPFDEQELRENPLFQELIVKAKLYNGDVTYTDKEEATLKRLTENPKVKNKMRSFFNRALIWHGAKQSKYTDSPADIVLNDMAPGVSAA